MNFQECIGKSVIYYDYLGLERYGRIVAVEPGKEPDTPWLYITDTDEEYNTHYDTVNGSNIKYAELRVSSDVILDV